MAATHRYQNVNEAIERAEKTSPFLRLQLQAKPAVAEALRTGGVEAALAAVRIAGRDVPELATALRRERSALALAVAIGDLAGELPLEGVVGALSSFADEAIDRALAEAVAARTPGVAPDGFTVIALGKLGSRELNYSSDVDLLFLYDPGRLPLKPREDAGQGAVRIAQKLIEILQKRDAEGYVFRVDLRLRPSPEVTPIALSADAAISYYESSALPWERAAFIRARCVAGDRALGSYFLESIHPFVWRRSLDFGAVQELQSISRRIRAHYSEGQQFGPGYDLKRGRGGIREIEFFAQIHQLIHGGRDPGLRAPATIPALSALAKAGHIDRHEASRLIESYRLLRTIEHRLQMVDDRQTHSLPVSGAELDNVAELHGLSNGTALLDLIAPVVADVAEIYGRLGEEEGRRLPGGEGLEPHLRGLGIRDAASVRARVEGWRSGRYRSLRTPAAQDAFEAMLPGLMSAFATSPDPLRAVNRFDDILSGLPSGVNFFRLIEARPEIAEILATILSHAPTLAEQLGRRPDLLDGLIDRSAFAPAGAVEELAEQFGRMERAGEDYQLLLDRVRRHVNERRFAIGTQLIVARSDPLDVAGGYARVAEAAIAVLADATIAEFEAKHGRVPGSELVILGLGRLGGEALTHASDLDLIYLFTGTHESESDGPKPLRATDYFNRLAPRITAALSVSTAAGPLYDVDTRLRPSGEDGLIAISFPSFAEYQAERAWTWEHMALTRARPVYGSAPARATLARIVEGVLLRSRDAAKLTADAVGMRREMAQHKPPKGPYDIKLGDGGLVDLEFAVHVLQLRERIALHPQLGRAIEALIEHGLLVPEIASAHDLLTRMLVTFRLVSPESTEPPPESRALVARACGQESWESLLAAHDGARALIFRLWTDVAAGHA